MRHVVAKETSKAIAVFLITDYAVFTALVVFLAVTILSSGMANIQTDSIDYYAIVQRLTQDGGNPIVRNLHFTEQRSPGYPILSLIPYCMTSILIEPLVQTAEIVTPSSLARDSPEQPPTERLLLPSEPILFKDVFFRVLHRNAG